MIEIVTLILMVILLSRVSEEVTKIPTTLFLIFYAYIITTFFTPIVEVSRDNFDDVLYLMIPIVLLPDLLKLSIDEVKKNIFPILYLAIFAVVASILIASFITFYLAPYRFELGALIALFTMLMATDAITVASIFGNFSLPEKLKIYAEGESLLNDVTALIIFYFIALPLLKGLDVTFLDINFIVIKVLFLSSLIGISLGYIGFLALKIIKDPIEQFIIIYLIGIISFFIAEHLHISGILSVITSILFFRVLLDKELEKDSTFFIDETNSNFRTIIKNLYKNIPAVTKRELRGYKKEAEYIGILANGVVFIIMAHLFELSLLKEYIFEILAVFFLTTLLRFISIFSMFRVLKRGFHWSISLTLSGVKGALTLIMVYSLPYEFEHREMFEAIIVGNILLTTFIYTLFLIYFISFSKEKFKKDMFISDEKHNNGFDISKTIKNYIEKDYLTKAYNKLFIEELIDKEILRANRYKISLSVVGLKLYNLNYEDINYSQILQQLGEDVEKFIRATDYFGKLSDEQYIILATNTSINGAVVLANKLHKEFKKLEKGVNIEIHFGVTQVTEFDTKDVILDKINDAVSHKSDCKHSNCIDIEV